MVDFSANRYSSVMGILPHSVVSTVRTEEMEYFTYQCKQTIIRDISEHIENKIKFEKLQEYKEYSSELLLKGSIYMFSEEEIRDLSLYIRELEDRIKHESE